MVSHTEDDKMYMSPTRVRNLFISAQQNECEHNIQNSTTECKVLCI